MTTDPPSFHTLPLEPAVLEALDNMGFKTMTPIQAMALPHLMSSTDFLGQAPTGTGKTATFGIPLVNRLQPGQGMVQALVVGPTRELAQQIASEINQIGHVKGIKALPVFGGERMYGQKERLRQRDVDIVVGTPGRILDHLRNVSLDLTQTRLVVLDEADVMLDMGFREDIEEIFKHLPGGRETWLFSATISPEIRRIADHYMYYPQEVRIQPQARSAEMIDQYYIIAKEDNKIDCLRALLDELPEMYGIIFCQTKKDVVQLARRLREHYPLDALQGAMPQYERDKVMEAFRNRMVRLLVSTDVVSRGIDIDSLTHIINFHPPSDPDSYIHRIGRTARKGETGIAITFFTPNEAEAFRQLEKRIGIPLKAHPLNQESFDPNAGKSGRSRHHRHRGSAGGGKSNRPPRSRSGSKPHARHGGQGRKRDSSTPSQPE